jgi:anti-sigma B factor antagonist
VKIDIRRLGDAQVAVVNGRIDLGSAPELRDQGTSALAAGGGSLVLDLADVEFIDSSGLGVLIGLQREAQRLSGRIAIVPPRGSAQQIFALTRTESFFTLVTDQETGRAALAA